MLAAKRALFHLEMKNMLGWSAMPEFNAYVGTGEGFSLMGRMDGNKGETVFVTEDLDPEVCNPIDELQVVCYRKEDGAIKAMGASIMDFLSLSGLNSPYGSLRFPMEFLIDPRDFESYEYAT